MIRLEMKNCNMILIQKHQKYQHYHPEKFDKYEYLTGEKMSSKQRQIIEQAKFSYSL